MADKFYSRRNLDFLLYEVFDAASLPRYPYYQEHSREIFDMILETALKMGGDLLYPILQEISALMSLKMPGCLSSQRPRHHLLPPKEERGIYNLMV